MKIHYKILTITLMIISVLFINIPVFATDNETDVPGAGVGGDGDYEDVYTGDGQVITIDYVKQNPSLFADFDIISEFQLYNEPFLNTYFNAWAELNYSSEYVSKLVTGFHNDWFRSKGATWHNPSNCPCGACVNSSKYAYFAISYSKTLLPIYKIFYTENPITIKNNVGYDTGLHTNSTIWNADNSGFQHITGGGNYAILEGKEVYKLFDNTPTANGRFDNLTVLYPLPNNKIMKIVDSGGNDITHIGTPEPTPDIVGDWQVLSSFDKEKTKMWVKIKNVGKNRGMAMINVSNTSAQENKFNAVINDKLLNFRTYGKRSDGTYSYFYNLNFNANEEKEYEIDLSNIDKSKITSTDTSVYLNILGFNYTDDELYEKDSPIFKIINGINGLFTYKGNVNNEIMTKMKPLRTTKFDFNKALEYKPPVYDNDIYDNGSNENLYDENGNKIELPGITLESFLKGIPKIFNNVIDGMKALLSSIQGFFGLIASVFSFLPSEVWTILAVGLSIVVILRALGR